MPDTTGPAKIWYPAEGSPLVPLQDVFKEVSDSVDDAFGDLVLANHLAVWGANSDSPSSTGQIMFLSGSAAGTTSSIGVLSHTFRTPFPNASGGVILMTDNESGYDAAIYPVLVRGGMTRLGFQTLWGNRANASVHVNYLAFGF